MKKMIIGMGIFICGMIILCTDYAIQRIIDAMPDVILIQSGISISWISFLVMGLGAVLVLRGYFER